MKYLVVLFLALAVSVGSAQDHPFVGYKYVPGDTVWYQTHILTTTSLGVTGGTTSQTRMEQTVSNHQYTLSHTDSLTVMVLVFDSLKLSFGGDSAVIKYDSNNPADSTASFNMMVFPLRALLGHQITAYINGKGTIDSVRGLDKVVSDASLLLNRSAMIQALRDALNEDMMKDMLNQQLANLPNATMDKGVPVKLTRARMVGSTQFRDDVVTALERTMGDTALLTRTTYTQVASPTIRYGGRLCVIDSTWGIGTQTITYDITRGVILQSHEEFSNYLRAGIANTNTSVIQTNTLNADVRLINYAVKSDKKSATKKRR